ncbi:MAG: LysM peptidoglycan-binding domain-containing protein, partial [Anaerolineae bacterium]|nr:LysM peptidoglycan-binding domain-containing protein [Anaerolineae bacterium]
FNVSLVWLANANNITNYNRIFVGQILTIPR